MFSVGIKPDDCRFVLTTDGKFATLNYREYFDIQKNSITDAYVGETVDALKQEIAVIEDKNSDTKLKLSYWYDEIKESYVIAMKIRSYKDYIYLSLIGELFGQMSSTNGAAKLQEIANAVTQMFSGSFIEHKYVREARQESYDSIESLTPDDAKFRKMYENIINRALELEKLSKDDKKRKKQTAA